ncbi:MAG: hypothetical protein H6649_02705 [Caldilineae bacterium]|nr:hypothetical protein [Anaerolineae bacterium]MCB0253967.1 hypothetical protein [Anaerolineae bacterium]MCB9152950.1 hypothetical protein [Caldilineae bacterium]
MKDELTVRIFGFLVIPLLLLFGLAGSVAASDLETTGWPQEKPGQPIIIRWSTETEVDTAGFNVYRSQSEEGPWTKINPSLIPGSPDPIRGGSYVFTDTNVLAGVTYWYELEEVELSGQTTRLERTTAVAKSQGLGSLPCGSALLPLSALGLVIARRGKRDDSC